MSTPTPQDRKKRKKKASALLNPFLRRMKQECQSLELAKQWYAGVRGSENCLKSIVSRFHLPVLSPQQDRDDQTLTGEH